MDQTYSGTRAMAASHAFDVPTLQAWLQTNLPGFAGPLTVSQFKGGQSNPTYRLDTPSRRYVMRTKPAPVAKLLPSAHAIEREFRIMQALAPTGVPVPEMLLLCEDESVIGRAFFLMAHVEGRVFWEQSLPALTRADRAAVYDDMNRVIAALHQVDVDAVGLASLGRPGNYFDRQIARWTRQYQASITQPMPDMDRLIEWLPQRQPASARDDTTPRLVHGDYRLDNLMFAADAPKVVAVLDWELATIGHPLADLSYHCMSWHIPPGTFRGLGGLDLAALGIPDEQDYLERYARRTGRDAAALQALQADWHYYLAYNLFRLAAISQGIAKRAVDGIASSAEAGGAAASAAKLAALGWEQARLHDARHGLRST